MATVKRMLFSVWNVITTVRRAALNVVFLLILLMFFMAWREEARPPLPDRAALLLNPAGTLVDQLSYVEPVSLLAAERSKLDNEVLLQDVIDAVDLAAADPAITALVMDLNFLMPPGISKIWEISQAISAFRETGKPVVAISDYYTQGTYLLAAQADTVIAHPLGGVGLEGFSNYQNYYRQALRELSINMHVFRAGEHKSIAEPWLRDNMSSSEKEISQRWLDDLWNQYVGVIETRRGLTSGSVNEFVNRFDEYLLANQGDAALAARDAGLLDELLDRTATEAFLLDAVGVADEQGYYQAVDFHYYLDRKYADFDQAPAPDEVALVVAQGDILDGEQSPGLIGGDSTAELLRGALNQAQTRAIVLRVNSGGGSVFASQVIHEAALEVRQAGIPFVVSMGSVAASGGYYIAANADEIWATPATVTGSIGVFAAFPTLEDLLTRFGVFTDGVGTTDVAGGMRLDRPLNPVIENAVRVSVDGMYSRFVDLVAQGRSLDSARVHSIAQGRVWSATDAQAVGLVDELGSLADAVNSAAALAGLEDYELVYWEVPLTPQEEFLLQLAERLEGAAPAFGVRLSRSLQALLSPVAAALREFQLFDDPRHLYVRCLQCLVR